VGVVVEIVSVPVFYGGAIPRASRVSRWCLWVDACVRALGPLVRSGADECAIAGWRGILSPAPSGKKGRCSTDTDHPYRQMWIDALRAEACVCQDEADAACGGVQRAIQKYQT
jgi:hypothetical protein